MNNSKIIYKCEKFSLCFCEENDLIIYSQFVRHFLGMMSSLVMKVMPQKWIIL